MQVSVTGPYQENCLRGKITVTQSLRCHEASTVHALASAIAGLWQARERLLSRHAKPRRGDDHDNYCKENNFH